MNDIDQYSKEIHKPVKQKFERRSVYATKPNDIWSIDLVDMSNIKEDNNNVTFLLNIIDVYSRYAYSFPLKSKKPSEILNAIKSIKVTLDNIWSDQGTEFYNKDFKKYCHDNNVNPL
jgi:transposase InsO family protein